METRGNFSVTIGENIGGAKFKKNHGMKIRSNFSVKIWSNFLGEIRWDFLVRILPNFFVRIKKWVENFTFRILGKNPRKFWCRNWKKF